MLSLPAPVRGSHGSLIGCTCICAVCLLVLSACWTLSSGVQCLSLVGWDLRIIPGSSSCVAGQLLAPLPCPLSALLNKWAILGHANIQKAREVFGICSVNVFLLWRVWVSFTNLVCERICVLTLCRCFNYSSVSLHLCVFSSKFRMNCGPQWVSGCHPFNISICEMKIWIMCSKSLHLFQV